MDIFPEDIGKIIYQYKLDMEIYETRKKFKKSLDIIKQYNHHIYNNRDRTEVGIVIGNITNRFCLLCHRFIVVNYYWKRKSNWKIIEKHYCKCR